jgi:hypothetical protein
VDFGFEDEESTDGMKALIMDEVQTFRDEVRNQARGWEQQPAQQQQGKLPFDPSTVASADRADEGGEKVDSGLEPSQELERELSGARQ